MKVRVLEGQVVNHNGRVYRTGEVLEIPDRIVTDPAIAGCVTPVEEQKGEK